MGVCQGVSVRSEDLHKTSLKNLISLQTNCIYFFCMPTIYAEWLFSFKFLINLNFHFLNLKCFYKKYNL